MAVMNMVKTSIHQIIHVVAVWNLFVAAVAVMLTSAIHRFADIRVHFGNCNFAFIPVALVFMMKMAVMHIIDMIPVFYLCVAAVEIMLVVMMIMNFVFVGHKENLLVNIFDTHTISVI